MKRLKRLTTLFFLLSFAFTLICIAKSQAQAEGMKTFFDSEVPGIKIQVNATAETQPTKNITVMLSLKKQTTVFVEYFNLSIFGFLNGTDEVLMANITGYNFLLNDDSKEYNRTFIVPENVWGVTYGKIVLTYNATYTIEHGISITIPYENLSIGFTVTLVENVYLKNMEEQFKSLNQTYWELQQNYTALQKSLGELDSTRQAAIALGVTTAFFVATTLYFVMRKPKQYW